MRFLRLVNFFALTFFVAHCTAQQYDDNKLIVSLYYESLCPDCIGFISDQINRAWKLIGNYFDIEFVPYGNAKTFPTSPPTFKCQHGESECEGNKMQACAIKYISTTFITQFIVCTMSTKNPPNAGPKCAQKLQIDFTSVQSCISSGEGDKLMYNYGLQTESLNPPHQYVPWILFNGIFNEDDNDKAGTDLVRVICSKLHQAPDECNSVDLK